MKITRRPVPAMRRRGLRGLAAAAGLALLLTLPGPAEAQGLSDPAGVQDLSGCPAGWAGSGGRLTPLVVPGDAVADLRRMAALRGCARAAHLATTLDLSLPAPSPGGGPRVGALLPAARGVYHGQLPHPANDGALRAGRGASVSLAAGAWARLGPLTVVLAPEVVVEENRAFQVIIYGLDQTPRRQLFASPWYAPPHSADYPLRFGAEERRDAGWGQSSIRLDAGPVALFGGTESLWWGPARRNPIVLGSNAPGFLHAGVRTAAPLAGRWGSLEGMWLVGRLEESEFFDESGDNDRRSFSGIAVAFQPAALPGLDVGLSRVVYGEGAPGAGTALDVFRSVGRPTAAILEGLSTPEDEELDQVFSLFASWVFPEAGFEAYGEWGRFEQPASLKDLLLEPQHSQGYTLGLVWLRPVGTRRLRVEGEATNLEMSSTFGDRPQISSYTSLAVEQGYTHRGQVLGAPIGPGASSQYLGADLLAEGWSVGVFGERVRWNNTAYYTVARPPDYLTHDVSAALGVRASAVVGPLTLHVEAAGEQRLNYLFQNRVQSIEDVNGVDILNPRVQLLLSGYPRW